MPADEATSCPFCTLRDPDVTVHDGDLVQAIDWARTADPGESVRAAIAGDILRHLAE